VSAISVGAKGGPVCAPQCRDRGLQAQAGLTLESGPSGPHNVMSIPDASGATLARR